MSADRLLHALVRRGLSWPAPIEHHESLGSTNDALKERARDGAPQWTVVSADHQTAGRGRGSHAWHSPRGNVFLSVLLRPDPDVVPTLLPLAVGLAVADAVGEMGVNCALKWPNDVLAGGRKIGGVLCEAQSGATPLAFVVAGVGVNLELDPAALPGTLGAEVTSVRALTGRAPAPEDAAAAVLARLAVWYDALHRGEEVPNAWRARAAAWWGRPIVARAGADELRGIARGLDPDGALVIELADGRRERLLSGEVSELRLRETGASPGDAGD
jgi:BirA family biotin operon repressor/biotin-[acetyl-CoA-carboxylase] ligase